MRYKIYSKVKNLQQHPIIFCNNSFTWFHIISVRIHWISLIIYLLGHHFKHFFHQLSISCNFFQIFHSKGFILSFQIYSEFMLQLERKTFVIMTVLQCLDKFYTKFIFKPICIILFRSVNGLLYYRQKTYVVTSLNIFCLMSLPLIVIFIEKKLRNQILIRIIWWNVYEEACVKESELCNGGLCQINDINCRYRFVLWKLFYILLFHQGMILRLRSDFVLKKIKI